jgi:Zn-dependent peptidase ImmA (M78 family)/transcriptional regulator with XRE-family HTH domain
MTATTKEFFVKERLTEAREARGVTQSDLAEAIRRSPSTVSNWERGEQAPEPASLDHLSRALAVPSAYFLRRMPDHGNCAIFFRSLANAAVRMRVKEKARVRWLQHISLTLQETLDFPQVDFPEFVERGAYKRLGNADLEHVAESVRRHWRLGEGPIPTLVLVAENAGVVVGIDEVGSTKIDGQGNWSAYDSRPYILLARDKYTAFRRQMDVAHELAHLILHRGIDEAELVQNFELIEDQAKYWATAFLLPHRSFPAEIVSLSLDGFSSLKSKWKVSVGAMIMRTHGLEILNDTAAQRLWKYRATRGWHRKEPLDDPAETPVEEPRLLRRSIELIVDKKVRSKSDLQNDICLNAADVEMLASLPTNYFLESASIVAFEPKLREREGGNHQAAIVPLRRPN